MTHPVVALTSLSPNPARVPQQKRALESWEDLGLLVYSFNHPSEFGKLQAYRELCTFIPVAEPRPRIYDMLGSRVNTLCQPYDVLMINADIELTLTPEQLRRLQLIGRGGLVYFVRTNWEGNKSRSELEHSGIDAFLMSAEDAATVPVPADFRIGHPYWDYWLPWSFLRAGKRLHTVEWPCAWHEKHAFAWSEDDWLANAREFNRLSKTFKNEPGLEHCLKLARLIRAQFEVDAEPIPQVPRDIHAWLDLKFGEGRRPERDDILIVEVGANDCTDTRKLAALPRSRVVAFEADPHVCIDVASPRGSGLVQPLPRNVELNFKAVGAELGWSKLYPSLAFNQQPWSQSSSIREPTGHLAKYPVSFGQPFSVEVTTLDSVFEQLIDEGGFIDFQWWDVQGAEGDVIRGGHRALERTKYLYTEYSDVELYAGQWTLEQILAALNERGEWRVLEMWPDNVLLEHVSVFP